MSLKLNSSGGGSVTLQEPSTANNQTLTLPDNTGTLVSTASTGVVTNAMLANGYPDQAYVTPVNPAYQNMGTAGYYNLSSISIPSSGDWRIYSHLRWGSGSYQGFLWIQLSTSSGSGGLFGYPKMQLERIAATSSNLNIGMHSEFIVRFGTAVTFPYTLYLLAYESSSGVGSLFLQNDNNGYNQLGATKISSTTSTASTPVQIGY